MTAGVVNLSGHIAGVNVDNVLGVNFTTTPTSALCASIATAFYNTWVGYISAVLSTEYIVDKCTVTVPDNPTLSGVHVGSSPGGQSYSLLPLTVCAKVQWDTALRGRSYRGRTGLVGLGESDTDATLPNTLNSAARTRISGGVQNFFSGINGSIASGGGGAVFAVVSQYALGSPRPSAVATDITAWRVYSQLGTRRSRLN